MITEMALYESRTEPAYDRLKTDLACSENPHILRWWTAEHDAVLADLIAGWQWHWSWKASDRLVAITLPAVLHLWRNEDPLCSQYAWYNVLMYFALSRAERLGLTAAIREPERRTCPLCSHSFVEDSLPAPLVERLGIDQLDHCPPCLTGTVLQGTGNDRARKAEILDYLPRLANVLARVPPQGFGEGSADLRDLDTPARTELLAVLRDKPTTRRVKVVFGSWLNALIKSGVLEDGTRKTTRGIQTIARDGHVCLSLGEKTIDDWLYANGIQHEKEPHYPDSNLRADFKVGGVYIEYFGLAGKPEYDAKTASKKELCRKHGIRLISLLPPDLSSPGGLERKLGALVPGS